MRFCLKLKTSEKMGKKLKCSNPFNHHNSKVVGKKVKTDNYFTQAAERHPNIDWSGVSVLCVSCKWKTDHNDNIEPQPKKIRLSKSVDVSLNQHAAAPRGSQAVQPSSEDGGVQETSVVNLLSQLSVQHPVMNVESQDALEFGNETQNQDGSALGDNGGDMILPNSSASCSGINRSMDGDAGNSMEMMDFENPSDEAIDMHELPEQRDQVGSQFSQSLSHSSFQSSQSSIASFIMTANQEEEIIKLNNMLQCCGLQTISKSHLYKPNEMRKKYADIVDVVEQKIQTLFKGNTNLELKKSSKCDFCDVLLHDLSIKFRSVTCKTEKYKILTTLPMRLSAQQIVDTFGCTMHMAKQAIDLRRERGIFSAPDPRKGNPISEEIREIVRRFYLSPGHSRPSPRSDDTIQGPNKTRLAKHHMLLNQRDLFALFKLDYPDHKIGRTSFLSLCPRECKWPGHKPFHNICLCMIHQNIKLQYAAIDNEANFKGFISEMFCNPLTAACAFGLCDICPKNEKLASLMNERNEEDVLHYKQWTRQDGTNFEVVSTPIMEFMDKFEVNLVRFIEHDFVYKKQRDYQYYIKADGLKEKPYLLVQVDYAQNYTPVLQDAVYDYHWTKKQVTLHPFSVTWWDSSSQSLKEKHYVVISDMLVHDADTFNTFKRKIMSRIKEDFKAFNPTHIIYVSDGCGGQYKNKKNMAHLMEHFTDFGMTAEWIFTATAHGKGPCDRVAAVVKRTTRINSLLPGVTVTNAKQMYDFCMAKLKSDSMSFVYVGIDEVDAEKSFFQERYSQYEKSIPGTRMFHHFIPTTNGEIILRKFSGSNESHTFSFKKDTTPFVDPSELEISNFYVFVEANELQVGMLVDKDDDEVEFQCMILNKRNKRCCWPRVPVNRRVTKFDVILHITEPQPHPEGYFLLLGSEKEAMKRRFQCYKHQM